MVGGTECHGGCPGGFRRKRKVDLESPPYGGRGGHLRWCLQTETFVRFDSFPTLSKRCLTAIESLFERQGGMLDRQEVIPLAQGRASVWRDPHGGKSEPLANLSRWRTKPRPSMAAASAPISGDGKDHFFYAQVIQRFRVKYGQRDS